MAWPQAVDDPGPVEVDPCGRVVGQAVETSPAFEVLLGELEGVAADRLEERMPRRYPLQMVLLGSLPMRGKPRILGR